MYSMITYCHHSFWTHACLLNNNSWMRITITRSNSSHDGHRNNWAFIPAIKELPEISICFGFDQVNQISRYSNWEATLFFQWKKKISKKTFTFSKQCLSVTSCHDAARPITLTSRPITLLCISLNILPVACGDWWSIWIIGDQTFLLKS